MCNLSDGIEERAVEKLILSMYENEISLEQISLITKKNKEEIEKIINKNEPVLA